MNGFGMMTQVNPMVRTVLFAAASMLILCRTLIAGVVINEVAYFMDPSGDAGKEWIELFNPDTTAIDLSGYQLHPGRTPRYTFPQDYTLEQRSFVVVHLRLTGHNTSTDLFEGTAPTSNMPNTKGSVSLFTNEYPAVIVDFIQYGAAGQTYEATAAKYSIWTKDSFATAVPCGYSLGLTADGVDSNQAADWTGYARPTPGYSNNPPPYDVAVVSLATEPFAVPALQEYRLIAEIANRGANTARKTVLTVFSDNDRDSLPGAGERIYYHGTIDTIGTAHSLNCAMPGMDEGSYALAVSASCSSDAYAWNNYLPVYITAGSPLVINEIMYAPLSGQPEWVELYNRSATALDLNGWTVEDLSGVVKIIDTVHTIIPPQGYTIITSITGQPTAPCPVLRPKGGLPSLADKDELLCIRYGRTAVVDQVRYSSAWGGGSNVSLERINPFLVSQEQTAWGGCVSPSRATPGAQNSVFIERPAAGAYLELSPNPFSPDNDGYEDNLIISLKLGWNRAVVTIRVYDRLGRLVRTVAQNREVAGNADLVWNGRNDQEGCCPMGLYVISLEAKDANGTGAIKKTKTVAIARKL
ncbi:MAG: lamin tail domain-containing protein [Candidatus Edwardsbacteria bacterium]|nr:lamin tail domain-containing protein [Candidatus Edwardsbacteria bacterium]